jgi:hypothetical protein
MRRSAAGRRCGQGQETWLNLALVYSVVFETTQTLTVKPDGGKLAALALNPATLWIAKGSDSKELALPEAYPGRTIRRRYFAKPLISMVGAQGLEPWTR